MAPAARLVKACRFSRVPITIHEKRMPRPMTRILLFASTALLAACATAQDIAPVETASTAPPAEATPAVPAEDSAELRSEEHTSELQSLMRISYAVFCFN